MKNILLTIAVLILSVTAMSAQYNMTNKGYVVNASGSDTIVAATNVIFTINKLEQPYYYGYTVNLADHSGGNTATMAISGSFDGTNFKSIASDSYTGVGTDTSFIGSISANPLIYPIVKFTVTPSDTILLKSVYLNVLQLK